MLWKLKNNTSLHGIPLINSHRTRYEFNYFDEWLYIKLTATFYRYVGKKPTLSFIYYFTQQISKALKMHTLTTPTPLRSHDGKPIKVFSHYRLALFFLFLYALIDLVPLQNVGIFFSFSVLPSLSCFLFVLLYYNLSGTNNGCVFPE